MKRYYSAAVCLSLLLFLGGFVSAVSPSRPEWLSNTEPLITKTKELPANTEPLSTSVDCTILPPSSGYPAPRCGYKTPIGTLATGDQELIDGPNGAYRYEVNPGGFVQPSVPNHPELIFTRYYTASGATIALGTYNPSALNYINNNLGTYYTYKGLFSYAVRPLANNTVLASISGDLAYSNNGQWFSAVAGSRGLVRFDINNKKLKYLAWDIETYAPSVDNFTKTNNTAITDDGRYLAIAFTKTENDGTKHPVLRVYDTESCRDQYDLNDALVAHNDCEYKDLWSGQYRTGNTRGLRDVLPTAEYPRRIRFLDKNTLTFDTVYDRTSTTSFKVARYSVTMPKETPREYVGLLGMGDSYISGEGATGTFFAGTDTKQNKCHVSYYSYPYRIGAKQFPYGRSVACSGAKMLDVTMAAGDPEINPETRISKESEYLGQDDKTWQDRLDNEKELIFKSFSPGYAQQTIFAREYKPRTVLLSVGGNDIAFAKILTTCVAGDIAGTCYQYYEDRVQLMQQILGQYDRLVKTYKSVSTESGGARVYVVGYPQIFKEGGNCGANVHFNAAEVKFGAQLIIYLNSVIKRAAAEAGVYYVDTESALNGYRLCEAPKDSAGVNGLTAGDDKGVTMQAHAAGKTYSHTLGIANESYHPTIFGHKLLAQKVLSSTTNLTAPMPAPRANNKPSLDYTSALLKNVVHAPEQQRHTEAIKWSDGGVKVLQKDSKYTTNIPKGVLKQGAPVKGVLRSEPVTLFEGAYDENTAITFEVPSDPLVGFHTFDVYGIAADGTPVDLREVVFVAEEAEDFDGDGVKNNQEACQLVSSSGVDVDGDRVDDACDGELRGVAVVADLIPDLPPESPISFDSTEDNNESNQQGIIALFVPPQVNSPEENNSSQTKKDSGALPSNTPTSPPNNQLATAMRIAGSLPPNYGYALTPYRAPTSTEDSTTQPEPMVLSGTTKMPAKLTKTADSTTTKSKSALAYALAGFVAAGLVLLLVVLRRQKT
ncbi:SGNH/GDSL hydrolase family protein [Candidatus Saccharibacteria bacterium]|nr:MAG: SGNH/GDSL hydrolase family protein [Candidatus Saccharibacteria bacterium]